MRTFEILRGKYTDPSTGKVLRKGDRLKSDQNLAHWDPQKFALVPEADKADGALISSCNERSQEPREKSQETTGSLVLGQFEQDTELLEPLEDTDGLYHP